MRRFAGILCSLVILTSPAIAGEPDPIGSPDLSVRLWAEYEAGCGARKEAIPALLLRLEQAPKDHRETAIVLDALIRLDARVPPPLLASIQGEFPVQAIILASVDADKNRDVLFDLAENGQDNFQKLAAWTVLAHQRVPGTAAFLLQNAPLHGTIVVKSKERFAKLETWVRPLAGPGERVRKPQECDLPPIANYGLSTNLERGRSVLSDGPTPVTYFREEGLCEVPNAFPSGGAHLPDMRFRLAYWMTGHGEPVRKWNVYETRIWKGGSELRVAVDAIRTDILSEFQRLTEMLVQTGALTEAEAKSLGPQLSIKVYDSREDKSEPLPYIEGLTIEL